MSAAMPRVCELFTESAGISVETEFNPTKMLVDRVRERRGEDIAILARESAEVLASEDLVIASTITNLAVAHVGLAVARGAAKPDISTVDALRMTLLDARCVAYSRAGASGIFFAELIERLGIEQAVKAKAIVISAGLTGELVATGGADLAVQQISELLTVPGIDIVGRFPEGAQCRTTFSGCVLRDSEREGEGAALLRMIASAGAAEIFNRCGLDVPVCRILK
jgi:molybdate transport system substrate-binding protein